jgi:3-dehydroquinate synthase
MDLYGGRVAELLQPVTGEVLRCSFPPGEAHKTRDTKQTLEDRLLAAGLDRQCCVVGLGGGISLDLAGFVAATFLRGVPWVGLPTSLLAQVDASVGGKTGVNTPWGKNLVGAFHQPALVLMDSELLATLPPKEWANGLAELVKHAVIADAALWGWIEDNLERLRRPGKMDPHPLRRCVEIKAAVVRRDEREGGLRAVLNFGHTVGHALEGACGAAMPHGRAVALGMLVEGALARDLCGFPEADLARLRSVLAGLGLDLQPPALSLERLAPYLRLDKKRRAGELRLALPTAIGEMAGAGSGYTVAVTAERLRRAWEEVRG